jgi:hypothetical protein
MRFNPVRHITAISILATLAALTACGGGGGGGDPQNYTFGPYETFSPALSRTTESGLTRVPTLAFSASSAQDAAMYNQLVAFVADLDGAYKAAPYAKAALAMARVIPNSGTSLACSAGSVSSPAPDRHTFTGCTVEGHQLDGTVTVSQNTDGTYNVRFMGDDDTPANTMTFTPDGATSKPLKGFAICTPQGLELPKCLVHLQSGNYAGNSAATWSQSVEFGWDFSYETAGGVGTLNGTHNCGCADKAWNVTVKDFRSTAGDALVEAKDNNTALIHRKDVNHWDFKLTVNGVASENFYKP